jgi:hypothetical protein
MWKSKIPPSLAGKSVVLLACLWFVVGCGKSKHELLIGTWSEPQVGDFTLCTNGTCTMGHVKTGKRPGEPMIQILRDTPGTWMLDGNTLILTPDVDKDSPHRFEIISLNETHLTYRWSGEQHERTKEPPSQ